MYIETYARMYAPCRCLHIHKQLPFRSNDIGWKIRTYNWSTFPWAVRFHFPARRDAKDNLEKFSKFIAAASAGLGRRGEGMWKLAKIGLLSGRTCTPFHALSREHTLPPRFPALALLVFWWHFITILVSPFVVLLGAIYSTSKLSFCTALLSLSPSLFRFSFTIRSPKVSWTRAW